MPGRRPCWRNAPRHSAPRPRSAPTGAPRMHAAWSPSWRSASARATSFPSRRAAPTPSSPWQAWWPASRKRCAWNPPRVTAPPRGPRRTPRRLRPPPRRAIAVAEHGADSGRERAELEQARINVRMRLERVAATGGATRREIIAAHLEFLDDPQVNEAAHELIAAGKSAGFAWRTAIRRSISALQALEDSRLRERVDDLLDVESHVLLALAGEARPMNIPLPERAVLVADDLLPSELTALDRQRLVAICLSGGGATSHVAILAAAMDIPMLVGLGAGIRDIANGATVIVDADAGTLQTAPTAAAIEQARAAVEARLMRRE